MPHKQPNGSQSFEWLAELRLGEAQTVIKGMENNLNIAMATFASWDSVVPLDEKTRQARDRWLVPVKVYRLSYPASGSDLDAANELLSKISGRSPNSKCKNGVCRLDDQRLANLNTKTNSP